MDIATHGATLVLTGDFDARSTMEVRSALYEHARATETNVVVDLTDVRAVDLTALKVLAYATRSLEREGRHLTLRGAGPAVRRMLHLSRLIRLVELERVAATA